MNFGVYAFYSNIFTDDTFDGSVGDTAAAAKCSGGTQSNIYLQSLPNAKYSLLHGLGSFLSC